MSLPEQLIDDLDRARRKTYEFLNLIDDQHDVYPGWTAKQFLAHLTGWDEATITSLQAHAAGKEPGTPAYRGIDFYNEQTVAERISLSYEHVTKEWELTRDELKRTIRALAKEKFAQPLVFPWGVTGSVEQLVGIMIYHEHAHADEIQKRFKTSGNDDQSASKEGNPGENHTDS
jgi:hypothetical protein